MHIVWSRSSSDAVCLRCKPNFWVWGKIRLSISTSTRIYERLREEYETQLKGNSTWWRRHHFPNSQFDVCTSNAYIRDQLQWHVGPVCSAYNKKFWKELPAFLPLIRHRSHRKWHLKQFFDSAGTCLPCRCLATIGECTRVEVESIASLQNYTKMNTDSPLIGHGPHRKRIVEQNYSIVICNRFQSKALRMIVVAPWYVPNTVIRRDLQIPTVKEELRRYSSQYSARLSAHPNDLIVNLIGLPDNRR
jgi:hypothetical protein